MGILFCLEKPYTDHLWINMVKIVVLKDASQLKTKYDSYSICQTTKLNFINYYMFIRQKEAKYCEI